MKVWNIVANLRDDPGLNQVGREIEVKVYILTEEEKKALLEREKYQFRLNESLVRSLLKFPAMTQKEVDFHMEACVQYLAAGYPYDGEKTPFVIGFKKEREE